MKTDELREKYLEFFVSKGCSRQASDVLVPTWDPSVLFTPAGMNPFKDHFLGKVKLDFTKATSCQKCLRTGDIDNVGKTAYHHTFFEMLGNFSFGDYFKREAINWAWEFLTSKTWMGMDPARLSVTVYLDDDEAAGIWMNDIGLTSDRITRCGEDENFWPANAPSQGPDGVCGPCSEIYYKPEKGNSVEIWNLVFTQFNRVGNPPDNLRPLPSKNIDTGMGLERCAATMQGVDTNYHIDTIRPIVAAAAEICGMSYDPASDAGRRFRRMADHARACTFAIHENVYPGPDKQKYVIRRLLRRAVLDGRQLGMADPFLHKLVPIVAEMMKTPYPELGETISRVTDVMKREEENFFGTIDTGLARIEKIFHQMKNDNQVMVGGQEAFDMYQTYGFPPELFETLASEKNLTFDWPGFRKAMGKHGEISGPTDKRELFKSGPLDALKRAVHESTFLGYESVEAEAKIVGIVAHDELCEKLQEVNHADSIVVVLDRSPFYGESGGQMGDKGQLIGENAVFEVIDTQRDGDLILHKGHLRSGWLKLGQTVKAKVDLARRQGIRRAHSATHILHHALQKHLGSHAQQQGSKVDDDFLRFDFTNPKAVSAEELIKIEDEANEKVTLAAPIDWKRLPIAEARKAGAMMLFGEKYPDPVRMVSMGEFSKELCGGTHADNTGQIGLLKIVSEESVSAGTRRITALTGKGALEYVRKREALLRETAQALKAPVDELPQRVAGLAKEVRELKKSGGGAPAAAVTITADQLIAGAVEVGGAKLVVEEIPGGSQDALRLLIDQVRKKADPAAILLASRADDKVLLIAAISKTLQSKGLNASDWVKHAAKLVDGGGGGRADMAQAGGKIPGKIPEALEAGKQFMQGALAK